MVYLWAAGPISYYFSDQFPPGQSAYIMMRPAGHIAFSLVFIQIALGLYGRPIGRWLGLASMVPLHRRLGLVTLWFVLLHPLLFAWARSLRSGNIDLLVTFVPNPMENYWERMLFVGAVALYAMVFGGLAALYGPRLMPRWWRLPHSINLLAFALAFWHAISIGSETRLQPVAALHWAMAAAVGIMIVHRCIRR
jgi:predicted ferric reductase